MPGQAPRPLELRGLDGTRARLAFAREIAGRQAA
jgi:hypothetical protein